MPHSWVIQVLRGLRYLGGGVCHQLPERSLQVWGVALPLCARCSGSYLGALIGLLALALRRRARASLLPPWPALALFGAFFLAWAADGINSYLTFFPGLPHLYQPVNALRLLTGSLQGLALVLVIWPVVAFTLWRQPRRERVVGLGETAACVAASLAVVFLLRLGAPAVLVVAGVLSDVGLLGLFTLLNTLVLLVVLRREGSYNRPAQALPLWVAAALLGLAELLILSTLRHWLLGF